MECCRERLRGGIRPPLLAPVVIAVACQGHTAGAPLACAVGDTRACVGPAACKGGQTCLPDRTGWTTCDCATDAANPPDSSADAAEAGVGGSPPIEAGVGGSPSPDSGPGPCSPGEDRAIDLDQNQVADCAETMVNNSQFVSSAAGWTAADPVVTLEWTNDDARGSAASGSMKVTNSLLSAIISTSSLGVGQCVPVVAGTTYLVAGQFKIPDGQVNPGANVQVFFFSDDACQTFVSPTYVAPRGGLGTWAVFSGPVAAAAGSRSARVQLDAYKNFPDPPVSVLYDNILFRPDS